MIYITGRKVKVRTGSKSQTVNICTGANTHGIYEHIIRIRPPFITEDTIRHQNFGSIEDLVAYLQRSHHGHIEQTKVQLSESERLKFAQQAPRASSSIPGPPIKEVTLWQQDAKLATEQGIEQFLSEFIKAPYLHRVEHSIHGELFKILSSREIFGRAHPMGQSKSQLIHKEWPEYIPRPEKGNRRGNFDLCILAPEQIKSCSFKDFREGRIRPSIVIEIGLDYGLRHLRQDAAKLTNSGIENSYLVHLVRQDVANNFEKVEEFLLTCGIRNVYARLSGSRVFYKLLNDREIRNVALPFGEPVV